MKNYMDCIITNRYHLVLEEKDVTKTLEVINKHHRSVPDMKVGNCGWANGDENKWFIHFTTTKAKWAVIRDELKVQRVFEVKDIPKQTNGKIYSTD